MKEKHKRVQENYWGEKEKKREKEVEERKK